MYKQLNKSCSRLIDRQVADYIYFNEKDDLQIFFRNIMPV